MKPIVINSPSLANCNLLELKDNVQELVDAGAEYLSFHTDNTPFVIRTLEMI